jgi:hypothetical protein
MAQKGRFLVMATAAKSQNVLQRKLAAARQGTGGNSRSALRALRLALARAAADAVGLPVAVIGATQTRSGPERLAEALTGDRLFLRLDGPEGRTGALAIDRALVAAVIRRQTTGRTDAPASPPAQRPFTATDAALSAPLVAALLDRAPALAEAADRDCLSGYACGAAAADLRALLLGLDGDRFRLFVLVAEIAGGPAQASLVLALPDDAEAPGPAVNAPVGAVFSVEDGTFAEVRAELVAVVGTLRLPLSRLAEMQPGDMLALADGRIDRTDLVAIDGRRVAQGRLGQAGGMRAVRLGAGAAADTPLDGRAFPPARSAPPAPEPAPPPLRPDPDQDDGEMFERHLLSLSPEQAAAEISELAGLSQVPDDEAPAPAILPERF